MASKRGRSELITGVFAAAIILAILAVVMYLQGFTPTTQGARYIVLFDDVGGLSGSAAVIVAGQRVGRVDGIRTRQHNTPDRPRGIEVEVQLVIEQKYEDSIRIPTDTIAKVQAGGLFGGADQVVLRLGTARDVVSPGQTLPRRGQKPTSFNDLMESTEETLKTLHSGVNKLAVVLDKDDFAPNIEQTLSLLRAAVEKLDSGLAEMRPAFGKVGPAIESADMLLADVRRLLEQNNAGIAALVRNLESASGRLDVLLADGKDGVPELVRSLNGIAGNLDGLVSNLNDLVLDNQLNFQIALQNIREASASLRVFTRRIERDPSLLVWGDSEDEKERARLDSARPLPNVDELAIRNSGRRPRKESD